MIGVFRSWNIRIENAELGNGLTDLIGGVDSNGTEFDQSGRGEGARGGNSGLSCVGIDFHLINKEPGAENLLIACGDCADADFHPRKDGGGCFLDHDGEREIDWGDVDIKILSVGEAITIGDENTKGIGSGFGRSDDLGASSRRRMVAFYFDDSSKNSKGRLF